MNQGPGSKPERPVRVPYKALGEAFEFDVSPARWPALGDLAGAVAARRRETWAAAERVVAVAAKLEGLRSQARHLDHRLDRSRRRQECLAKARLYFQDRLERLDRQRAADRLRLEQETVRLARALNETAPPRPGQPAPPELALYVESVLELRQHRTSTAANDHATRRLRRALGRIGPKLDQEARRQARLARHRDARLRAAEHGAEIEAEQRRRLHQVSVRLVRAATLRLRIKDLHGWQARRLSELARRADATAAPLVPGTTNLARLRDLGRDLATLDETLSQATTDPATEVEAGRRCLEQIERLNRRIDRARTNLDGVLGLITPQAQTEYLTTVVLPRLDVLGDRFESLYLGAKLIEKRRVRIAREVQTDLDRRRALARARRELADRLRNLGRHLEHQRQRSEDWERAERLRLIELHRGLAEVRATGLFPDLTGRFERLRRRHRAARQEWRSFGRRVTALGSATRPTIPAPPRAGDDPELFDLVGRLRRNRVRIKDLKAARDLCRRTAEPLRDQRRALAESETHLAHEERIQQLEALVQRLGRELKRLVQERRQAAEERPEATEPERRATWDGQRVKGLLQDTAPVISFLAAELERVQSRQRELARSIADKDAELARSLADKDAELARSLADKDAELARSEERTAAAQAELAAARDEAESARLAAGALSRMLGLMAAVGADQNQTIGRLRQALVAHDQEVKALRAQLARLSVLYLQLLKQGPRGDDPWSKRLSGFARRALPQALAVILAAGSMLLANPTTSSEASFGPTTANPVARLSATAPPIPSFLGQPTPGPRPLSAPHLHYFPLNARMDLDFLTPAQRAAGVEAVVAAIDRRVALLAEQCRLPRQDFLVAAHRTLDTSRPVKMSALAGLAERIRTFRRAHPRIFRDSVDHHFLSAAMTLWQLAPSPAGRRTNWFKDRLYADLVATGMNRRRALAAVVANTRAALTLRKTVPRRVVFVGQTKPLPAVEAMGLAAFVRRFAPYIADNCRRYLRARRRAVPKNLDHYARRLAFDIYCAAKTFRVPLTLMLNIPHQETYYANVLGDHRRSASPFQIFAPTKKLILSRMASQAFRVPTHKVQLQNHLALSAYLAAYYLRDLIDRQTVGHKKGRQTRWQCNLDNVVAAYNGSRKYIRGIRQKRAFLIKYLQGGRRFGERRKGKITPQADLTTKHPAST